jgi:hypothetical protein
MIQALTPSVVFVVHMFGRTRMCRMCKKSFSLRGSAPSQFHRISQAALLTHHKGNSRRKTLISALLVRFRGHPVNSHQTGTFAKASSKFSGPNSGRPLLIHIPQQGHSKVLTADRTAKAPAGRAWMAGLFGLLVVFKGKARRRWNAA